MSDTKTFLTLGGKAQDDNLINDRLDYIRRDQAERGVSTRVSASEIKAIVLAVGTLGPALLGVLALVQVVSCWGQSYELTAGCRLATGLFWAYIVAAVTLAIGTVGLLLWGRLARTQAEIARASITRDRYSNPVPVGLLHSMQLEHAAGYFRAAQDAELAMAPYKQLPSGLDALTLPTQAAGKLAEPALATPATPAPGLTPEADWFPWLDTLPHMLISGRTDAGKTTLAEAIIAHRVNAGDLIHIIDPHYQPGKWCGVDAIGGGRNYDAVFASLDALRAELDARYEQFNAGKSTSEFQRLTVVVDEVPAIISRAVVNGKIIDKRLYERWLLFATGLGSEARKVRLSVVLLSQSHLVRDIYISSAMRENFTRLALGETAADLLREEIDHTKRQALIGLLAGRRYPAAMEYRGALYALRNDEVPALARTMRAQPQPWPGSKAVVSDKAAKISAYRAKIRRMGDAEWRAEVQRLATAPGDRRGGYRFTIEQIRALVGRDQNTVAELCKEARQKAGIKV